MSENVLKFFKGGDYVHLYRKEHARFGYNYTPINKFTIEKTKEFEELNFENEEERKAYEDRLLIHDIESLKESYDWYYEKERHLPKEVWEYVEHLEEFFERNVP